ncbi:MAG: hypothetical protein HOE48_00085 [Candidatus Latescibacteria bacterium]|jgi:hypothetical protein|nr:hypothetical protein [Candidatus Latescibacterota bacterium]MBT4136275.1 hypothetical protein [Candidatus Latescibacterota bacterium]MBT5832836.1 hypothetical protein [Candidatus Latescibacterota bacterium]
MLVEQYPKEKLQEILENDWHPYPTATERDGWDSLPDGIRQAYIARGEQSLSFAWPSLTATSFLDHVRTGTRTRYQAERNQRRNALANLLLFSMSQQKKYRW